MNNRLVGIALCSLGLPALAGLETPDLMKIPVQSGISVISGFDCAASRVFVQIDQYPPLEATAGTERNDTVAACGKANTGFSVLFNYNTLAPGSHSILVYSDKGPFAGRIASGTILVEHFGSEFLRGARADATLFNFPRSGARTTVVWDENLQNFRIGTIEITPASDSLYSGKYYGAVHHSILSAFRCGPVPPTYPEPTPGTFQVKVEAGTLSLVATLADGRSCHAAGTISDLPLTRSGAVSSIVRSSDCTEFDQVYAEVDGDQLITRDYEACTNVQVRAVR